MLFAQLLRGVGKYRSLPTRCETLACSRLPTLEPDVDCVLGLYSKWLLSSVFAHWLVMAMARMVVGGPESLKTLGSQSPVHTPLQRLAVKGGKIRANIYTMV